MTAATRARGARIPTDPSLPVTVETIDTSPAGLARLLDGLIHVTFLPGTAGAVLLTSEDARIAHSPANTRATCLYDHYQPGFAAIASLYGNAYLLGTDTHYDLADAPQQVLTTARVLSLLPAAAAPTDGHTTQP